MDAIKLIGSPPAEGVEGRGCNQAEHELIVMIWGVVVQIMEVLSHQPMGCFLGPLWQMKAALTTVRTVCSPGQPTDSLKAMQLEV